jgi:hypothetical protein
MRGSPWREWSPCGFRRMPGRAGAAGRWWGSEPSPSFRICGWVRNEALDVSIWSIHRPVPEFFRDARLRDRLGPDPNLLVLPYNEAGNGNALLWQAESGMSFSMPGGNVSATIPPEFTCWPIVGSLIAGIYSQGQVGYLRSFLKGKEVDAVVVPVEESPPLTPLLDGLPVRRWKSGGVYVYDLPRTSSDRAAACPG